jgi:two-component system response regulator HydG
MTTPETPPRILVVDDRREMAETVTDGLSDRGFTAVAVGSSAEAATMLEREPWDALVTDLRMPGIDGLQLLAISKKLAPERPVIVMTAYGAIDTAIESIRRGASHYLLKPFKLDELVIFLQRSLEQVALRKETSELRRALRGDLAAANVVAKSKRMREVLETTARVADADAPVLVTGETGTGKGLIARMLHDRSNRAAHAFVSINCAALPEALLESELFGHVKGAFTGATANRHGLFVEAHGGTIFLDEIGDMAPSLQAKLLHVLERGVVRPVGGTAERRVDVRVVAATHRDLRERVSAGTFREDLLYRIDVVSIALPPLRDRREDLPDLVELFFENARSKHKTAVARRFDPPAMALLLDYAWPGNVRELAHAIERMVLLARGEAISVADVPEAIKNRSADDVSFRGDVRPLRELQRRYARWALSRLGGHRTKTAEALAVDPKTLARLLEEDEPPDRS